MEIIEAHGFALHRDGAHKRYRGVVGGIVRFVDVDPKPNWGSDIGHQLLANMIRQSGLRKKLFRQ